MKDRADTLGVDRELDRILVARRGRGVFARRELQQLLGIDGDGVGVDRGGSGDGGGDDVGLGRQALRPRLDDVGAKLVEQQEPTTRTKRPPRFRKTMRRVKDDEKRETIARQTARARSRARDLRQRALTDAKIGSLCASVLMIARGGEGAAPWS